MTAAGRPLAFRGVWTALATPFREGDLAVDFDALDRHVDAQIAAGVDVLIPCGTTGESPTLTHDEHDAVVERVVRRAAGRVPVVAGTGSNATAEALRLTRHAAECGADGALVVCPYYNRPSPRMLAAHFRAVAAAAPALPVVLYNVPSRTGVDLQPETVAEIRRECPNVAGIKEACGDAQRVARIRALTDIAVLSGDDALTVEMIRLGATGVVSVASNAAPRRVGDLVRAALAGDFAAAGRIQDSLTPLFRALFVEPNPVPVKRALELQGVCSAAVRPPLLPSSPETTALLRDVLASLPV